ncbi:glycosyltransferase family 4 protein [Aestuariivivens sediminis]|uniref:glycosyltransferase family 4 protein n=1 Tax=Aestuariivivens sediminis TaxID=2913557 RepID=UPI001F59679E|nr:glycosyltransferase [Aestuariivivens sediminis]
MLKSKRILFVLHFSPPVHGASKVGDTIVNSQLIKNNLNSKFVKIKSSDNLQEIGTLKVKKLWYTIALLFKVVYQLFVFRPQSIYLTASPQGFAFYRDLIVSIPIKVFCIFKSCTVFYHYHAKGIDEFVSKSLISKNLTNFFINNTCLIFINEKMLNEVKKLNSYKKIFILNNGVPDPLKEESFKELVKKRSQTDQIHVLYLSNMMKSKGYDIVLNLAKWVNEQNITNIKFHFAGSWHSKKDMEFFNSFRAKHDLWGRVEYHGLVDGSKKMKLFRQANVFVFPSRYKKEVFPLSVLEALSYGLPVLAFNAGAVADIVNPTVGIISNEDNVFKDFKCIMEKFLNESSYYQCRNLFLSKYTVESFEKNLVKILNEDSL